MDLRRHWVQDGRIRSHCNACDVERVFFEKKEFDGSYSQSTFTAGSTSSGWATAERHSERFGPFISVSALASHVWGRCVVGILVTEFDICQVERGVEKWCAIETITSEERNKDRKRI